MLIVPFASRSENGLTASAARVGRGGSVGNGSRKAIGGESFRRFAADSLCGDYADRAWAQNDRIEVWSSTRSADIHPAFWGREAGFVSGLKINRDRGIETT